MRRLLCPKCASESFKELCAEDKAEGWKLIRKEIKVSKKPAVHNVTVHIGGESTIIPSGLVCDFCLADLEGKPSVAVSMIKQHETYNNWEKDYEG